MDLPKCTRCGIRLTSLSEIDGYGGLCSDCYKQGQREETVVLVIFAFVILLLLFFVLGLAGYF